MSMSDRWKNHWMAQAELTATLSKDPSTKVGAVIVQPKFLLGSGYNGFPTSIIDDPLLYADRPKKYALTIHAEMNAILNAFRSGHHYEIPRATMFTTLVPCAECAKIIAAVGIQQIYCKRHIPTPNESVSAYYSLSEEAARIFDLASITYEEMS